MLPDRKYYQRLQPNVRLCTLSHYAPTDPNQAKRLDTRCFAPLEEGTTSQLSMSSQKRLLQQFRTIQGLDFEETFAPVLRIDSVHTLFAIFAGKRLYIIQTNIKNAFLHSTTILKSMSSNQKALPMSIIPTLFFLSTKHFTVSNKCPDYVFASDTSMYIRAETILVISGNAVINELSHHIQTVNNGEVKSFLGLKVVRNHQKHTISINQPSYIDRLLAKFNMTNVKSASTQSSEWLQ